VRLDGAQLVNVPVQGSLPAQHAVHELSEQGSLFGLQLRVPLKGRPHETVGIGGLFFKVEEDLISQSSGVGHGPSRFMAAISCNTASTRSRDTRVLKQGPKGRSLKIP